MSHSVKSMQRIFLPKIHRTYRQRMWHSLKMVEIIFHIKNLLSRLEEVIVEFLSNFDYDCRVCSSAQDILQLYSQIRPNKVALEEHPVATNEAKFSATIFYTLQRLKVGELSDVLLFETSEKARYTELSTLDKMREWVVSQGISKPEFNKVVHSKEVKEDVGNAIYLTEEYGVFTFPYVVVGGKYVLTASTLYNDDYGVAVLDFLVNKLEQERKK
jgi:thiol:disulfide interchange protein DsbA